MWTHKEGNQSDRNAINRAQIRGALAGAIANQQLMLEWQRFCGNSSGATRAEEFRKNYEQMNREEQQIAHKSNGITLAKLRKTGREGRFRLHLMNSHPTGYCIKKLIQSE